MIMASLTHKVAEGFFKPSSLSWGGWGGREVGFRILPTDLLSNTFAQPFLVTNKSFDTNYVTSALMA